MALRWGIASTGKIADDFVNALRTLPTDDHQVVAVAARSRSNAEQFAKKYSIASSYEGYTGVAQDQNVDIVYVGVLHPQHFEVTKLMLEHGKHVLCEKPFTLNEKQTRELVRIAREKKVFLMEAIWSRCFPAYDELRDQIESGKIGKVLYVRASMGFPLENVERLQRKELGGGAILDLGVYVLQLQQYVYSGLKPVKIEATGQLNELGTDESGAAYFTYDDGQAADLSISARFKMANHAVIVGSKGIIKIPEFWCPTKLITHDKTFEYDLPKTASPTNYHNSAGLAFEAEHVRQCIKAGLLESPKVPLQESIELAGYMDTWRREVGVVYEDDVL